MKALNRLYAAWSLKAPAFPARLQIETTNRCNAACRMCPILEMDRPKGEMDFALLDKIARELAARPPLRRVILHVMGEPLLNPEFLNFLSHLKKTAPQQPLEFSTNGALLDEGKAAALAALKVEAVNFSLDACTPQTYAHIRRGLNFEKVLTNLKGFIQAVSATGRDRPRVRVQLIKMDVNEAEWAQFAGQWRAVAREHPFVEVYVKEQWSWGGRFHSYQSERGWAEGALALPCGYPFDQLDVYWDGRVGFCCLDQNADLRVGDLNSQSLAQIWRSPELAQIRRRFKRFDFAGLRCAACGERARPVPLSQVGGRPRAFLRRLWPRG